MSGLAPSDTSETARREEIRTFQQIRQDILGTLEARWLKRRVDLASMCRAIAADLEETMQTSRGSSALTPGSVARHAARAALVTLAFCTPASSQTTASQLPPYAKTANLSGPRFGLTLLADGVVKKLEERSVRVGPYISQFGWQFEKQFYTQDSGVTMVTEWVALVGGLEQSVALPSVSWMVGVRTRDGAEFGIGPNVTPAGTALVLATGMTFRAGALNVPLNVAVVPSKSGTRVSVLSGFSLRHR